MAVHVHKPYQPDLHRYQSYIHRIYESGWLTNNGPLVQELERRLCDYLGVRNVVAVANGTLALMIAFQALEIRNEVITTPFSFVATTSSLVWNGLKPVFADIDSKTLNINSEEIERNISRNTSAIVPVHVFGNACEVETIEEIALRYNIKVVYDAAHCFDIKYRDKSLLKYGDASAISFHATKLFHTIEGGAIITDDDDLANRVRKMINFGITGPDRVGLLGINAKMNEFEAAMGLSNLDEIDIILGKREEVYDRYMEGLKNLVEMPKQNEHSTNNYSYFPVILRDEDTVLRLQKTLNEQDIFPRRYFYPSLDELEYVERDTICPVSRDISRRIMCLPMYPGLLDNSQNTIIDTLRKTIGKV